jgi:hypothetical protein
MANRNQSSDGDFTATEVLPAHLRPDRLDALDDAVSEAHGRYQEYVRSLDEVPVLVDVAREPPHSTIRDFRLGQRPDARKAARDDAVSLREEHAGDVAAHYAEYIEISRPLTTAERAPPHRAVAAKTARKTGAQKKRAKRAKRSARSKS